MGKQIYDQHQHSDELLDGRKNRIVCLTSSAVGTSQAHASKGKRCSRSHVSGGGILLSSQYGHMGRLCTTGLSYQFHDMAYGRCMAVSPYLCTLSIHKRPGIFERIFSNFRRQCPVFCKLYGSESRWKVGDRTIKLSGKYLYYRKQPVWMSLYGTSYGY